MPTTVARRRSPGPPGYAGQELVRLLGAAPAARGSPPPWRRAGRSAAARARADANLGRPGRAVSTSTRSPSETDVVFLALPEARRRRRRAGAARARHARLRPVRRVPAARRERRAQRWYPQTPIAGLPVVYGLTERNRERCATRRSSPARAAIRPRRCWRSQPLLEAGLLGRRRHHRREVGHLGRRQDADASARTSPSATAASPPTASSRTATRPRSSRSSARR